MISTKEIYEIDRRVQSLGIPALVLIENAGANAARIVHEKYILKNKNILIFAGTGNNGGDGLVFARHAQKFGANTTVFLSKSPETIRTEETKTNYDIVKNIGIDVYVNAISKNILENLDIACDALLGIGLRNDVKEPYKKMIEIFNNLDCAKISLDCPSGIDADTGESCGIAAKPDMTVTFYDIKKGLNQSNCGELIVTDIGIKKY